MTMLQINVEQIKESGPSLNFRENAQTFPVLAEMTKNEDLAFVEPIDIVLSIIKVGEFIEISGKFTTTVRLACARCLENYETSLVSEFELTYTRQLPGRLEESLPDEKELTAAEMGLIYFEGEQISLQDGIQERVVMALPLRPLCHDACQGLCPSCGTDLNQKRCACETGPSTNQFAVLKDLKLDN